MRKRRLDTELATIRLQHAPERRAVWVERIDSDHVNLRRLWHEMGEPKYLSPLQVHQLQAASCIAKAPIAVSYANGMIELDIDLPPQGIAAVTIEHAQ